VLVAASNGNLSPISTWRCAPLAHRVENMTTESLTCHEWSLGDGTSWAVIAKTLRPASTAPGFAAIPPEHHPQVLEDLDWLDEPRIYRSGLANALPDGLRMPRCYAIDEESDRITLWLEKVPDVATWTADRYHRSARALGELGGLVDADGARVRWGLHGRDIGRLFAGKVRFFDLVVQADDSFWQQPHVAGAIDANHRRDLERCAVIVPQLLDRLGATRQGICHGDATPDNLLGSDATGDVVAIDWSYGHVGALGTDLGQLLVGRFESGAAEPEQIIEIADAILTGYCDGLDAAGITVRVEDIRLAWAVHLAIRSVFSALVIDHRPDLDSDGLAELTRRRAAIARFGLDLAASVA
jgi:hypothetical protein